MGKSVRTLQIFGVLTMAAVVLWLLFRRNVQYTGPERTHHSCANNLKQIGLALRQYHESWKCFPPAFIRGPDGRRWHSWRVLILPYMGQEALYANYHFDEPWDGPNNRKLWDQISWFCVHDPSAKREGKTSFVAVVGTSTVIAAESPSSILDIIDGTANTVMVVETSMTIPWFAPIDLSRDDAITQWGVESVPASYHSDGRLVLTADGSVRIVDPKKITRETWEAMLTRDGGENLAF